MTWSGHVDDSPPVILLKIVRAATDISGRGVWDWEQQLMEGDGEVRRKEAKLKWKEEEGMTKLS
jgi:hypothetical protein